MIRFSLHCEKAHEFEIWFGSNGDFTDQQEKGLVECPLCGSHQIEKSLMAPAIAKSGSAKSGIHEPGELASDPVVQTPPPPETGLAFDPQRTEMIAAIHEMVRQVRSTSEDVGKRFPDEARKIHHGEAKKRGIFGQASADEARELLDEGIAIAPLPDLPEDLN